MRKKGLWSIKLPTKLHIEPYIFLTPCSPRNKIWEKKMKISIRSMPGKNNNIRVAATWVCTLYRQNKDDVCTRKATKLSYPNWASGLGWDHSACQPCRWADGWHGMRRRGWRSAGRLRCRCGCCGCFQRHWRGLRCGIVAGEQSLGLWKLRTCGERDCKRWISRGARHDVNQLYLTV